MARGGSAIRGSWTWKETYLRLRKLDLVCQIIDLFLHGAKVWMRKGPQEQVQEQSAGSGPLSEISRILAWILGFWKFVEFPLATPGWPRVSLPQHIHSWCVRYGLAFGDRAQGRKIFVLFQGHWEALPSMCFLLSNLATLSCVELKFCFFFY